VGEIGLILNHLFVPFSFYSLLYPALLVSCPHFSTSHFSTSLVSSLPLLHLTIPTTSFNQLCRSQKKADLECYYEPLSKCTIHDAKRSNAGDVIDMKKIVHVGDILIGDEERIRKKYEGE
jgi:hypothetical protein